MNDTDIQTIVNHLPTNWQAHINTILVVSLVLGRILHSVKNGGGLKSILASIWLGKTTPPKTNP